MHVAVPKLPRHEVKVLGRGDRMRMIVTEDSAASSEHAALDLGRLVDPTNGSQREGEVAQCRERLYVILAEQRPESVCVVLAQPQSPVRLTELHPGTGQIVRGCQCGRMVRAQHPSPDLDYLLLQFR